MVDINFFIVAKILSKRFQKLLLSNNFKHNSEARIQSSIKYVSPVRLALPR
jgi:hypothetical protein